MKITAITKFKHGKFWGLLKKKGWTVKELSDRSGINASELSAILNLRKRPTPKTATAIELAFLDDGDQIDVQEWWPETFKGINRSIAIEETQNVDPLQLTENLLISDSKDLEFRELEESLEKMVKSLTIKEAKVIEMSYCQGMKDSDIAQKMGITRSAIEPIRQKAIRKMRHPRRLRLIEDYAESQKAERMVEFADIHRNRGF